MIPRDSLDAVIMIVLVLTTASLIRFAIQIVTIVHEVNGRIQ